MTEHTRFVNFLRYICGPIADVDKEQISSWDIPMSIKRAEALYPHPYAFYFTYETSDTESLGGSIVKSKSGTYYINGKIKTLAEIKAEYPEERILIDNLEMNGYDKAVKTCCGAWEIAYDDDSVVESEVIGV